MNRQEVEDFIFIMADIIEENKILRSKLKEAEKKNEEIRELREKYYREVNEGMRLIFELGMADGFRPSDKTEES